MPAPNWADQLLSDDLPNLRARGEGQELEYMQCFPLQARDLGKEIAAFAATNPGTILIGVSDEGDLTGLASTDTSEQRDELLRRVEGICRGTIKPAITPTVKWAVEADRRVLAIEVPKGAEPVYYSNNVPYVRHLSESRPAEPHEVVERVRAWLATQIQGQDDPVSALLGQLASVLVETLIYAEQTEERDVNPWLDQWRAQYEHAASRLRDIAADGVAVERGMSTDLNELADALDAAASFILYMGCDPEFGPLKRQAIERLVAVKGKYVDTLALSDSSLVEAREALRRTDRQLANLTGRMEDRAWRNTEEVQSEASALGFTLLRLSYYAIDALKPRLSEELRPIGRDLHLVETVLLSMDGGQSVRAIIARINAASARLHALVETLP